MATRESIAPHSKTNFEFSPARKSSGGHRSAQKAATALGWFSIGLGLTEILTPQALSRWIGVSNRPWTMRLMGMREVAVGVGLLSARQKAPWLWARVAGDAVDLAALTAAAASPRSNGGRVSVALGAVAGVTALDALYARELDTTRGPRHEVRFTASITINRPPQECYRYWRDIEKLPTFLHHLKSVRVTGDRRSQWTAQLPNGNEVTWEAEITEDQPDERIAWRSVEGSSFPNSGRILFQPAPAGRGTIVRTQMAYKPTAATGGRLVARLLGADPSQQARKDLMRFKQMLEAGEIATTEGQPAGAGRRGGATSLDRWVRV